MSRNLLGVLAVLLWCATPAETLAQSTRHIEDAALHAVQFVDDKEGWAVGDDGVIWHTIDGGQNWEDQESGVRSSLRSLYFHSLDLVTSVRIGDCGSVGGGELGGEQRGASGAEHAVGEEPSDDAV